MSAIGRAISTLAEPSMPSSHAETGPGGDRARRQAARRVRSAEGSQLTRCVAMLGSSYATKI